MHPPVELSWPFLKLKIMQSRAPFKPEFSRSKSTRFRFIPACAGNTAPRSTRPPTTPVHPRVCGEHHGDRFPARDTGGSSPRVRGTRQAAYFAADRLWFIPACAGNTPAAAPPPMPPPVHPRVCGEHRSFRSISAAKAGSSPRVRGTLARWGVRPERKRFIPACAGNTGHLPSCRSPAAVHPRVCGEHVPGFQLPPPIDGSSPRVRGTLSRFFTVRVSSRFIPACAGNTGY